MAYAKRTVVLDTSVLKYCAFKTPKNLELQWPDWAVHPVPQEQRHVCRNLHHHVLQLEFALNKAEANEIAAIKAHYREATGLRDLLEEKYRVVDEQFDLVVTALASVQMASLTRQLTPWSLNKIMLEHIVPAAREYFVALSSTLLLRKQACDGVLKGRRDSLMSEHNLRAVQKDRDDFLAAHRLGRMDVSPHEHVTVRRSLVFFNLQVARLVKAENHHNFKMG